MTIITEEKQLKLITVSLCCHHITHEMITIQCHSINNRKLVNMNIGIFGARGSVVVRALCCKPEGRGFKSR
jgi:hypothetical protein